MKWTYQIHPLTVVAEYTSSPASRPGYLYGHLELTVRVDEFRLLCDQQPIIGSTLDDIESKARKRARSLAQQVMSQGGDFIQE